MSVTDTQRTGPGSPTPEPPARPPEPGGHGLRVLLICLVVLFSVAATVLVSLQLRAADQSPETPSHDPRTGIALTDVVASMHEVKVRVPSGFEITDEYWDPTTTAASIHNAELDLRFQLFLYRDHGEWLSAAEECVRDIDALEDVLEGPSGRSEPVALETATGTTGATCTIRGAPSAVSEEYLYTYHVLIDPEGLGVTLQSRIPVSGADDTAYSTYFICIAGSAARAELASCG